MSIIVFSKYPFRIKGKLPEYVKALSTQLAATKIARDIVTHDTWPSQTSKATDIMWQYGLLSGGLGGA